MKVRLVEMAGDDDCRWNRIQHAKDSDSYHEFLELIGFRSGSDAALLLNHRANPEQRHKAGEQESRADDEINEIRRQYKVPQMFDGCVADVADAGQRITVNSRMNQHRDALKRRNEPSGQVEKVRNLADGFIAPL